MASFILLLSASPPKSWITLDFNIEVWSFHILSISNFNLLWISHKIQHLTQHTIPIFDWRSEMVEGLSWVTVALLDKMDLAEIRKHESASTSEEWIYGTNSDSYDKTHHNNIDQNEDHLPISIRTTRSIGVHTRQSSCWIYTESKHKYKLQISFNPIWDFMWTSCFLN